MNIFEFKHSYNRAGVLVFIYLGALFGPFFIVAGYHFEHTKNLILGVILTLFTLYYLYKAFWFRKSIPSTDKLVFLKIPLFLLPVGLLFAAIGTHI